ncbi:LysM peptidoglycan-binding domain-containing protein [Lacticaseibacillus porcinae]|uniref:LysM peptidoglycan-binding domain-containing protein n=1 Tax=Lacticaseibacillus porcinae TaxID=1123687 RepID=UPI0013DE1031|nr:LysM domain-containing protein [Lacticaseibacillus porcinae]
MRKKTTNKEEPVQQDASDQTKPWNKQFEDDRDDNGNLSRVATRKKKRGGSILAIVVWVALALVIIIPVTWQALRNNSANANNYTNDKITVSSTSKKAKSHSSSKKSESSKKSSSSTSSSESSSSESSVASSTPASSSSVASSSSSVASSSSSTAATGTYTVKAGDNLYRIAVNHGMTLSELLQLNGMSSGASISAGQTLKVNQ